MFILSTEIISFLVTFYKDATGRPKGKLIFTGPLDAFATRLKIATYGGIVLALPVWLYQLWRFITPGLNPKEKRYAVPFVLSSIMLFALGGVVALFTLEPALDFLLNIGGSDLKPLLTADRYISLVSLMIVAFGLSFEFPVVLMFLLLARVHHHAAAPQVAALGHRGDRRVRRGDHAEPGSLLAVRDGDTHVHLLRSRDHHRKVAEAMSQRRRDSRTRHRATGARWSWPCVCRGRGRRRHRVLVWVFRPEQGPRLRQDRVPRADHRRSVRRRDDRPRRRHDARHHHGSLSRVRATCPTPPDRRSRPAAGSRSTASSTARSMRSTPARTCSWRHPPARARPSSPSTRSTARSPRAARASTRRR